MTSRACVIAIAGGSCSGKTTLAQALAEQLNHGLSGPRATLIMQDSYYADLSHLSKPQRDLINFDHPDSLDFGLMTEQLCQLKSGSDIDSPTYDFSQHQREPSTVRISATPIVIVEGTLILTQAPLREQCDLTVFVSAPEAIRLNRRLQRDTQERGRSTEFAAQQFTQTVAPMHNQFVEPSRRFASLHIDGCAPTADNLAALMAELTRHC